MSKHKKLLIWLLPVGTIMSPFVTWRIFDWYMVQLEIMVEEMHWTAAQASLACFFLLLGTFISFAIAATKYWDIQP